jgi:antitoxin (DNA-binding transcriptional repressor) of toxin-antitoxin stability system
LESDIVELWRASGPNARTNFRRLIQTGPLDTLHRDWVEAGEAVAITRRGKIVACLAPPGGAFNAEAANAPVERIRARRREATLGGVKIADLIAEGRT